MLLGAAQLEYVTFELSVLSRYRHDPRFKLHFEDYAGGISLTNDHYESGETLDRDRIAIQTFGLAIDADGVPHVVVFFRYLHDLSDEHQQYWNSFVTTHVPMCYQYYQSSILGEFWENRSIRNAIRSEIEIVNLMAVANFGKPIFRLELESEMPLDISAFLVPSVENFEHFVHSWDKMLSDNLNYAFFEGTVEREKKVPAGDGGYRVELKGSIALLEEWIEQSQHPEASELASRIGGALRKVRKLRQEPAHRFSKNSFRIEFYKERRALLCEILGALQNLRDLFAWLPKSSAISVPSWLDGDQIEVF